MATIEHRYDYEGEWEQLALDGELIEAGHGIDAEHVFSILENLGHTVIQREVTFETYGDDGLDNHEWEADPVLVEEWSVKDED